MEFFVIWIAQGVSIFMLVPAYFLARLIRVREIAAGWSASKGLLVFATCIAVLAWVSGIIAAMYIEHAQGVSHAGEPFLQTAKWYAEFGAFLGVFTVIQIVLAGVIGRLHATENATE